MKKQEMSNMNMADNFASLKDQMTFVELRREEEALLAAEEGLLSEAEQAGTSSLGQDNGQLAAQDSAMDPRTRAARQEEALRHISAQLLKQSRQFDIDESSN